MNKTILAYIIAIIIPIGFFIFFDSQEIPAKKRLKRFVPLSSNTLQQNKIMVNDTLWHTLPDFSFTTQSGDVFTSEDAKDKVLIVGFFAGYDKKKLASMNEYYKLLQEEFKEDKEVILLSHTVLPGLDSLERIQQLVQEYKIDDERWFVLGGTQNDIDRQVEEVYHLPIMELPDSNDITTFKYPSQYVLVGRKGIIRGYYDLESLQDVKNLMSDIRWLQLEYPTKHKREIEWKLKDKENSD